MVASKLSDVSVEDVEVTALQNLGLASCDGMRKVFESSNMEMLDNAFEGEVCTRVTLTRGELAS